MSFHEDKRRARSPLSFSFSPLTTFSVQSKSKITTMVNLTYGALTMVPALLFSVLSLPVKQRNTLQESLLVCCWMLTFTIPIYHAGQQSYIYSVTVAVLCWAIGMKMTVWLFCYSIEDRCQSTFVQTLFSWRSRTTKALPVTTEWQSIPVLPYLTRYFVLNIQLDLLTLVFQVVDHQRPKRVLDQLLHIGNPSYEPTESLFSIALSFGLCALFCLYLQLHMQSTYEGFMLGFASVYQLLPFVEDRLNAYSKTTGTKTKPNHILQIHALKYYLECTVSMQPLFFHPWSATHLRDFWSKRWHTIYNDSFYHVGYRPLQQLVKKYGKKNSLQLHRVIPMFGVFVLSGIMHEYILYCVLGSLHSLHFVGGFQCLFFSLQIIGIVVEDVFISNQKLKGLWALCFMMSVAHFFVVPYLATGYISMERFSFIPLLKRVYLLEGHLL
ncbi:membrane bound O-acyl transferase family-domain-containing protein [Spinellus fusiger]|nr:membrane bound O-acyl transferase family-domain-containing protein [Spinellus fusiger]